MMRRSLLTVVAVGCTFAGTLMAQVSVTTKLPSSVTPGSEFTVELNISKGDVAGFAKLQQDLPTGFTAVPGETANSTFSFKDRKVKFLWMALPATSDIKVSYKVQVDANVSGNQVIEGNFSYIRNNETEKFVIPSDIVVVGASQAAAQQNAAGQKAIEDQKKKDEAAEAARLAAQKEDQAAAASTTSETGSTSTQSGSGNTSTTTITADNSLAEQQKREADAKKAQDAQAAADAKRAKDDQAAADKEAKRQQEQATRKEKASASGAGAELKSKPGLVFRVQISAGPNNIDPSILASKYNITEPISVEQHDGLSKYIVGEFGSYRPAKTFCNELRDNNNVEGPFVTAYNNGVRIHVKEALDIAGQ